MRGILLFSICCTAILAMSQASGETWYVDDSVSSSGDGTSWGTAFKTIQEGMDASSDADTVIVAEGTYVENIHFNGKNIVLTSTDPLDPNVVANTIIDGNQADSVVTFSGTETEACMLSGCTIQNGRSSFFGGGIIGNGTHATIQNNTISGNSAGLGGGGLSGCNGTIHDNRVMDNSAGFGGALQGCNGPIANNTITNNSAEYAVGGLYGCNGPIQNNTVSGNSSGGLYLCTGNIRNCIVWENEGSELGSSSVPAYSCIQNWTGGGEGNIAYYPYFVDPLGGDYHLLSWSPCIDAGDPAFPFSEEPEPNGGRINMGSYGNTPEAASKSSDTDGDGVPDDWERRSLGSLVQGPEDDPDDDLVPNLGEYRRGTDPLLAIWYVDASVQVPGDGASWETAFKKIQEGIDAARNGNTVVVAPARYVENIRFNGKNIVLRSTNPLDAEVVKDTVIDGNQAGSVVTFTGTEDETCVLSGFTIRNGKDASQGAGGICGGGPFLRTRATIQNNIITANSVVSGVWGGGGLAWCDGVIQNNIISRNSVVLDGGGLCDCNGIIESNTISENSSYEGGGLAYCNGVIRNNIISANSATFESGGGGGLYMCNAVIENNLITGNSAVRGGGLRLCSGKIVQGNTIAGNLASEFGGGLSMCAGTIRNCIMWGNTTSGAPDQNYDFSAASFCCIQNWTTGGTGNISDDPLFVDAPVGDYHLQAGSPCIDKGANFYWFVWPQRDLDGNCRLVGGSVDIGCYEHGSSLDSDGDLLSDAEESSRGTHPGNCDSDGDGLRDGVEVLRGTDPLEITPPATVHVPGSVPTIQQALSLAMLGDEIIIAPGTYTENVIFCGADVVLRSSGPDGPAIVASTILDGDALGPVVTFIGFETEACVLSGFTIRNGNAVRGGGIFGGIAFRSATRATIEKNVITGNTATSRWWETAAGGGLFNCNGLVRNNTIAGNSASARNGGSGGGLHSCNGTIESNTISDNSASEAGGGLSGCNGLVRNNTITRNSASGQFGGSGGGLFRCGGTIQNCIIWGNTAATGAQLLESSAPTYSCIQNWTSGGEWNIALDPRFANLAGDDYRLLGDSPCIDAGKNEDWMWQAVDLDGNPRLWRGKISLTVDMGAYEYGSFPFKVVGVATGEGGEAQLTWTSRPGHTYGIWSCVDLLTGSWIEEATISSGGETTTWADTDTISMRKFYRAEQLK